MSIRPPPWQLAAAGLVTEPDLAGGARPAGRFVTRGRGLSFWAAWWTAGLAAELAVLASVAFGDDAAPGYRVTFRLLGGAFVACGLIAWRRRPDSRIGLLMTLSGFGLFVEPIFAQFASPSLNT